MNTDSNSTNKDLLEPVVFRASFNNFERINQIQAWSLFFTGGRNDLVFGQNILLGQLFTSLLIAIILIEIVCTL